eukprot:gene21668-biopygen21330
MAAGEYTSSEGGTVATKVKNWTWGGAICDGQFTGGGGGAGAAAAAPMVAGKHYIKFEVAKSSGDRYDDWMFGVCRPGSDLNDGKFFHARDDTWLMYQDNDPEWSLRCKSNKGNFVDDSIKRELNAGDRVGLLLDLDNGGTLTLYLDGKPCGTIAEGLAGPLHWCVSSLYEGKAVRIHAGLEIPPQ